MNACKFLAMSISMLLALRVFDADLQADEKVFWRIDNTRVSFTTEIDGGLQKIKARDGGKYVIVTGTFSHADIEKATVFDNEVILTFRTKDGAEGFPVQCVAIGLAHAPQITWCVPTSFISGGMQLQDQKKVVRLRVTREKKGEPTMFALKEDNSVIALAFPIPKDAMEPFDLRFGDLKKTVSAMGKK